MLAKPKKIDARSVDVSAYVARQLAQVAPSETEATVIELLHSGRDITTLRRIAEHLPAKGGLKYDAKALAARAQLRMERAYALSVSHSRRELQDVLDVGCARAENYEPAMACGAKSYTGLDLDDQYFPDLAPNMLLTKGSVEAMPYEDGSFDYVFSFNVLEHVTRPEKALDEIVRVLRPGGVFHTVFGPQFNAANGPHLTRQIDLPFMHHLFREDVVAQFVAREDAYETVNRHPLAHYRDMFWAQDGFELAHYREHLTGVGFGLLKGLPELNVRFNYDELAVNAISATVVKR